MICSVDSACAEIVATVAGRHVPSHARDGGHADARVFVDLAIRQPALEPLDDGPAIRHRLEFSWGAQVAKERAAFVDVAQGQNGLIEGSLCARFLPGCEAGVGFHCCCSIVIMC